MWLFTKHGFFSAVCARQGNGEHGKPLDLELIMVRARVHDHLTALKNRFPELLGGCEIQVSTATDYAIRLFVPKYAWAKVLAALAEETDYDNFKSEVLHHQGKAGMDYEHSLHQVWSVMQKSQR